MFSILPHSHPAEPAEPNKPFHQIKAKSLPLRLLWINQSKLPKLIKELINHIKEWINPCSFFFQAPVEVVGGEREKNWEGGVGRERGWQKPGETEQWKGKGMGETEQGETKTKQVKGKGMRETEQGETETKQGKGKGMTGEERNQNWNRKRGRGRG